MKTQSHPIAQELQDCLDRQITFRARQVASNYQLQADDEDDLRQGMWLAVLQAIDRHEEEKGDLDTLIEAVLSQCANQFGRSSSSEGDYEIESIGPNDHHPLINLPDNGQLDEHGRYEFREDLRTVLSSLGPYEREIAFQLMHFTPTEVMQHLDLSKENFQAALTVIRKAFAKAGIENI